MHQVFGSSALGLILARSDRMFLIVPSQAIVGQWLSSFKEFPVRQKPASFNLDEVMLKLTPPGS